ncbi:MAG TPA: hypothetical protein VIL37_20800 [Natronosporangium sp.]
MKRRWWLGGLVAAWAIGLLIAAIWSVHNDPPTVRGQSDLEQGRATLEAAIATVVEVAGPAANPQVQPQQLTTGCRISVSRDGTELDQTVVMTVPAGQEGQLLERLAAELPADWDAHYNPERNRFRADAGDFVAIRGEVAEPGEVRLTAGTGCRPS